MRLTTLGMLLALFLSFAGEALAQEVTLRGRIYGFDKENSTLLVSLRQRIHRIKVNPNTVLNRDGARAEIGDFEVRDLVRATGYFDTEDPKTRVLQAHTVVGVSVKGPGKTTLLRGRVTRLDTETSEFYLNLGRHSLRIRMIEGETEVKINDLEAEITAVINGDVVAVLGTIQRADDGSFELMMSAKTIQIFRVKAPDNDPPDPL